MQTQFSKTVLACKHYKEFEHYKAFTTITTISGQSKACSSASIFFRVKFRQVSLQLHWGEEYELHQTTTS